jgi:hypothetical protein
VEDRADHEERRWRQCGNPSPSHTDTAAARAIACRENARAAVLSCAAFGVW